MSNYNNSTSNTTEISPLTGLPVRVDEYNVAAPDAIVIGAVMLLGVVLQFRGWGKSK